MKNIQNLTNYHWGNTKQYKIQLTHHLLVISAIYLLAGCGITTGKKTKEYNPSGSEKIPVKNTTNKNKEKIYYSLPPVGLPLEFNKDMLYDANHYKHLEEEEFHRLTDMQDYKSFYDSTSRAARLPQKDNLKFMITGIKSGEEWRLELYSLTNTYNPSDRLEIYSVQEEETGTETILKTFRIEQNYRIIVSRYLKSTLIEQLTYAPNEQGFFEEIRDGKTVTVAYESFDGRHYHIQTFIWDYNTTGGLIKKELITEEYLLTNKDGLIKSKEAPQKNSGRVTMKADPEYYKTTPLKIPLKISNETNEIIQFGAGYEIEKLINGNWMKLEFTDDIAFISIMYILAPGKSESYDIYLYPDKISYGPGKYRIKKNILINEENKVYYAYFNVNE